MTSSPDLTHSSFIPTLIRRGAASFVLAVFGAVLPADQSAVAVPVIPGADGYGINTAAGRGGTVYKVTWLHAFARDVEPGAASAASPTAITTDNWSDQSIATTTSS